jgi:hypothetical protein
MAIVVVPEWPERTGRQRKYIGDSFVMNIRISRISFALKERLLIWSLATKMVVRWLWWQKHFKQSRRWPTIKGKDPGEAYRNGINIRDWVMAGIA